MIDRRHDLPVKRQDELLGVSRASVYYLPKPVSADDLALMRVIDQLHLETRLLAPACCATCSRRAASRSGASTSPR